MAVISIICVIFFGSARCILYQGILQCIKDSIKNISLTFNSLSAPLQTNLNRRRYSIVVPQLDVLISQRGYEMLLYNGYPYSKSKVVKGRVYWSCRYTDTDNNYCKARLTSSNVDNNYIIDHGPLEHNHPSHMDRLVRRRKME